MNYTKQQVNKLIEQAKKEAREQAHAEVYVLTKPLLTLTFWAEKLNKYYNSKQAFHYVVEKHFPEAIGGNK
jgi:hypothetical protein